MNFDQDFDFRQFYKERDQHYWTKIAELVKDRQMDLEFVLRNYMAFIQRRDLPQLLTYYELLKLVKQLPGSIAEVGVFVGNGLFTWTKLLETFYPGNRGKKVFGFDNFAGYDAGAQKVDKSAIAYIKDLVGDFTIDAGFVHQLVELHNLDGILPGVERVKVYDGELDHTIAAFKNEDQGVRLKLLLVDVNLYEPTKKALNEFYDLLVPGGIIALRGYGVKPWEGEGVAVDEFLKERDVGKLQSFEFSMFPSVYFRKIS